jgi:cytochrome P450/NADPH-cytochrome P450 reductase
MNPSVSPVETTIPQPRPRPLIGNVPDIDTDAPVQSLMRLGRQLGPLYRLTLPGQKLLVLSGHHLVADACDEKRFAKHVHGPLEHIRDFAGDGLFTAYNEEPNWERAHRILLPAFGPAAMKNYFADMLDVADQMLTKWERLGPETDIDVPDAMTRLTLDTIALCGFAYRFNSFYQREMHPFVEAMVRALTESGKRTKRLPLATQLMFMTQRQHETDIRYMHEVTDAVIARRRATAPDQAPRDLLGLMLAGKDPVTGEGLDDANIRYQLVTFLIAGHETTSGLLSFVTHLLLRHPEVLARARQEVDQVLGDQTPRFEDLRSLRTIDQILRETLRLYPTAPAFAVHARQDTLLGGRYPMKKGEVALALLPALHRDPAVWKDPERFDPDRFSEEARAQLPPKAWLPFGNGARACLGRAFAMQEATLVLAMMLQRFELGEPAPYQLKIKETLTLKPEGLLLRVRRRQPPARAAVPPAAAVVEVAPPASPSVRPGHGTPLLVLFGSNSGASEGFARRIAGDGAARGYAAEVASLDDRTGQLPTTGATVIVTASYNGEPPDNARRFCAWLAERPAGSLPAVKYAVFGCGNRDWGATYQRVPTSIDQQLAAAGAQALFPRGEADARGDFFGDFDQWYAPFWDSLAAALGVADGPVDRGPLYDVEVVPTTTADLVQQNRLRLGTVIVNRELVDVSHPVGRSKRHLEIALPEGMTYVAGDYLAVLPENHPRLVERVARRFGLRADSAVVLHSSRGAMAASLPTDRPLSVQELLGCHVELSGPATRKDVERLAAKNVCPPHQQHLLALAQDPDRYRREVLEKRASVIDLLEAYPSCQLSFAELLEMLPAMRVRQYSIASSPRRDPRRCSLTVAVVDSAAWSGIGQFRGTCSSYLAGLKPGDSIAVAVRAPRLPFHPPAANDAPIIMVCAGTGLAPFRGFLEERALRRAAGEPAGPALLFFGCNHAEVDFLYREELARWQADGLVTVLPAFFHQPDGEIYFVQHRLARERTRVRELMDRGATVFVCGDGRHMAPAVRATFARLHRDQTGCSEQDAQAWIAGLEQNGRYVADVFA